jgi:hypothetical protein
MEMAELTFDDSDECGIEELGGLEPRMLELAVVAVAIVDTLVAVLTVIALPTVMADDEGERCGACM